MTDNTNLLRANTTRTTCFPFLPLTFTRESRTSCDTMDPYLSWSSSGTSGQCPVLTGRQGVKMSSCTQVCSISTRPKYVVSSAPNLGCPEAEHQPGMQILDPCHLHLLILSPYTVVDFPDKAPKLRLLGPISNAWLYNSVILLKFLHFPPLHSDC